MLGTLRFVLAMLVVASHLLGVPELEHLGWYAVRCFFVVSGFVITAALHDVYRFDVWRFGGNRLLRLLPAYWIVLIVTIAIQMLQPQQAAAFLSRWGDHPTASGLVENFVLVPLAFDITDFRPFPPGWSLGVELLMYMLLWCGVGRTAKSAAIGLAFGAAYHLTLIDLHATFKLRYFAAISAVMPFSAGACIYFLARSGRLDDSLGSSSFRSAAVLVWLANMLAAVVLVPGSDLAVASFYVNSVCCVVVVGSLAVGRQRQSTARGDRYLGELAYPVFLCQWIGAFAAHRLFLPDHFRGLELLLVSIPLIVLIAMLLNWIQTAVVEPVRTRLRLSVGQATVETVAVRVAA